MRNFFLLLALVNACGAAPQELPDSCSVASSLADGTDCVVCSDGQRSARAYSGPDGWCEYSDGACACHGHGAGEELCAQLAAAACR